jgi:hypothetical protein
MASEGLKRSQAVSVVLDHDCPKRDRAFENFSEKCGSYGPAFHDLPYWSKTSGCWAVSNGEYASPVWFCPYCGEELRPHREEACEHDFSGPTSAILNICAKCGAKKAS